MPEGKKLLQLVIVGLGFVALVCSAIVSCVLHDKDVLQNTIFIVAAVGFWSWMGDVWS
jgi:hypothetical protein